MARKPRGAFLWLQCERCHSRAKSPLCARCMKLQRQRTLCTYCRTARRTVGCYCAACREIVNRITGERSRVGYATEERIAYLQARAAAGLPLFD